MGHFFFQESALSAGLAAAKCLVAMAAGQRKSEKNSQQIILLTPRDGDVQKQYLLTASGQLQEVVIQEHVELPKGVNATAPNVLRTSPQTNEDGTLPSETQPENKPRNRILPEEDKCHYVLLETPSNVNSLNSEDQCGMITSSPIVDAETDQTTGQHVTGVEMAPTATTQRGPEQYQIVMEEGMVYRAGDIVSLSMAASNVYSSGVPPQLMEEQVVASDTTVVTSEQLTSN